MTQGRDITNGSLYLVTSSTKCTHWGIAVVERPDPSRGGLRFVHNNRFFRDQTRKYHWKGSSTFTTMSTPALDPDHGIALNQCVFLRGFKIKLRGDIWDDLINERRREKSHMAMSPQYADLKPAPVRGAICR
ncbi:hypothetical protein M378DRAFT_162670 [Amanita muscaria Koide BX008]|uniref:Uncharacterized protein n=1 Tax=Amanita muscaria (strain Koide BX008) TaxID=946122 RepID=A0A0C2X7S9_AMAMK|nr:hypothetical protein M378DRAFT_162670 [Amanita muscaria Koide BX008]